MMMSFTRPRAFLRRLFTASFVTALVFSAFPAAAIDLSNGLIWIVPTPGGKAPTLAGRISDWDLSGAEPFWVATQTARQMNATVALEYDADALYYFAKIRVPDGKPRNDNSPADPFWNGDMVELRLASDPALPYPLPGFNAPQVVDSKRICHVSMWKNTATGISYLNIAYGGNLHAGNVLNPPGTRVAFTPTEDGYLVEAKLPWSALSAPDGKNPFAHGQRMTLLFGVHWKFNGFFVTGSAIYNRNPGDFGFRNLSCWGQAEFSPKGNLPPRHATMEATLAAAATDSSAAPAGVPITVDVPAAGKLSVNILGPKGEVIRELAGGQPVVPGRFTTHWDGRDQWGFRMPPGQYKWGAYFSDGLKARYIGTVGTSGNPPYPTKDEKGGWGGDHGVPSSAAADSSGSYLGWIGSEAQRQIVKLAPDGRVLWRKSPFVQGGFASLYALASNGRYLFAAYDAVHPMLSRVDTATGSFVLFDNPATRGTSVPVCTEPNTPVTAPEGSLPPDNYTDKKTGTSPECLGLAASSREVFASVYSQDLIQVLDAETGKPVRSLSCPRPRGLALDKAGNLYAVSCGTGLAPRVFRFDQATGPGKPVVTSGLVAPFGVAVGAGGEIAVTDEGASQQVKLFSSGGKLLRAYGKEGGRPWIGSYDPDAFLCPSAIASDTQGGLVVAESSIPKIFDRIDLATGKNLARWFGYPGYGVSNIPDPEDPLTCYYPFEPHGFARATIPASGGNGYPTAYWDYSKVEGGGPGDKDVIGLPYVRTLRNGVKYFIQDTSPHYICIVKGDSLLPVGRINVYNPHGGHYVSITDRYYEIWIDGNGDHRVQPSEIMKLDTIGGKPVPVTGTGWSSMWLDADGSAYFVTQENSIVKLPADGFTPEGAIRWNPKKASVAVPSVVPSLAKRLASGPRQGMSGVRADSKGNIYTSLEATIPALTPELQARIQKEHPGLPRSFWWVYADPALAKRMHEGLGHTAENNVIKFAKFGPDGRPVWIAGRKATAAPHPGELYHFWSLGGMVGDRYFAGASEWGLIYFYTTDGFYVDAIMNDPATLPPAGPYTFGSETFSGRITAYPSLGKVYAYQEGGVYEIEGFNKELKVSGEKRFYGTVSLNKTYEEAESASSASSITIAPLSGDFKNEAAWNGIPTETLAGGNMPLATVQVAHTADALCARIHVADHTPLQNGADDAGIAFKGGDVVGLDLGPPGDRKIPGPGDIRLLAALIHGRPRLIAMKPVSTRSRQPQDYATPASGTKHFDFVGDVPGGVAILTPDADGKGYTALLSVPKDFLEFPLVSGSPLKGDIEVLLSGAGARGLGTASRNWLFSGGHVQTTMVDDIPTEAWLYPSFWGAVKVE